MRRKEMRVHAYCRVTYSGYEDGHTGTGIVTNISMEGCQIVGIEPVSVGTPVWMSLSLPGDENAIEIDVAKVQWVRGLRFGVRTLELRGDYQDHLRRFLDENDDGHTGLIEQVADADVASVSEPNNAVCPAPATTQSVAPLSSPNLDLGISLSDLLVFVRWMRAAQTAMLAEGELPSPPELRNESLKSCVRFVQELGERAAKAEKLFTSLPQTLHTHDSEIDTQLLHVHRNLAALYESLGMSQKADEIRRISATRLAQVTTTPQPRGM